MGGGLPEVGAGCKGCRLNIFSIISLKWVALLPDMGIIESSTKRNPDMETETETAAAFTYKEKWAIELTRANALERQIRMMQNPATTLPRTWVACLSENESLRAKVAGLDREVERRTAWIKGQLDEVLAERDHYMNEISALHLEYGDRMEACQECDGAGTVTESVQMNYPCSWDEWTPAEVPYESVCSRCLGTKKEWMV